MRRQFPDIYIVNHLKMATILEVRNEQGWTLTFRRFLNGWEVEKMTLFFNTLEQAKNPTCEEDKLMWKVDKDVNFKVNSAYKLMDISTKMKELWPWKLIWNVKIPHKVACFTWLVARQSVLTQDSLMKRGRQLCPRCFFCESEIEIVNHLFLPCKVTEKLWMYLHGPCLEILQKY